MARRHTQQHRKQAMKTTAGKQQAKQKKPLLFHQLSFLNALFAVFTAPVR
jgi:hypothetical protein